MRVQDVQFQRRAMPLWRLSADQDDERDEQVAGSRPLHRPEWRRASILIAEDEALIGLTLRLLLEDAGYSVLGIAASAEAATGELEAAARRGALPDLVLMDVTLQGSVDGIELARRIRAQYAGIRVVYLTGQADPATRQRAAATAPAAYILKPFSGREIVEAIDRILAGPDRDG